jgi:hypothetical protein
MTPCNFIGGNNISEDLSAYIFKLGVMSALKMEAAESFKTLVTTSEANTNIILNEV